MLRTKIWILLAILVSGPTSWSATISAVKGQKVLINLDGDSVLEGDEFFLINPATGKRSAIIRVKQVKGGKALGEVLRGRPGSGYTLQAKAPSKMSAEVAANETQDDSAPRPTNTNLSRVLKDSYGIVGGYLMNSMDADVSYKDGFGITQKASVKMSGSGFGVGGFYDYVFSPSLVGRGFAAIEQFNVSGSASSAACSGSTSCDAKINYLSMYGMAKWYPYIGKYRPWLGGGMGYLLAVSKSSTALNESQISTNSVFTFAFGTDVQLSRKNYVPVSLEYNMFPASSTVKASQILLKAGWAWNL
ncbi:hypothetical protein [Bdellovibrio sp. ArHS]|uniref:hypothetical protein n=1 Tax=Bdellovibrio sp. ArHS TaxID=1569284 RepID=UPI000A968E89|nr:hypothetical protein [Bdellovibrio sp. ArHS]